MQLQHIENGNHATPTAQRAVTSYVARHLYHPGVVHPPQVPNVEDAIDVHLHCHGGQQDPLALADAGFKVIARERQYVPNNVETVMLVNRQWAQSNRATMVSLLKEMTQVSRWLKDPTRKNEVTAAMAQFVTIGDKPIGMEYAERLYNDIVAVNGGIAADGFATPTMFQTALDILVNDGIITKTSYPPLDQIVDFSYLNAARHELGLPNVKATTTK